MIGGPYVYLAAAAAFLAALGGAYVKGRSDGGDIARSEYAARDIKAASEAQDAYKRTVEGFRAKEAEWQKSLTAVSKNYQQRIAANETQRLADRAAAESLAIVLRDPNANPQACSGGTSAVAGTAAGRDGSETGRFSPEATRFLLGEANRADAVTIQLQACQAILASERQ